MKILSPHQRQSSSLRSLHLAAPTAALLLQTNIASADVNDYPTEARVDYVIACMASNDQSVEMLRRCSCSIDVIASLLPYERYAEAETVLRMSQVRSESASVFREGHWTQPILEELRRAQIEADFRCF